MFKTFPEFSKLTLADRKEYEALVKDYPPMADISFGSLMSWWNQLDSAGIATLNDNLVIPYWVPGDERNSGLSLVGTNKIDESICSLLDYLRDKGEEPRLVNVPELVVNHIQYPDLFSLREERSFFDYIIALDDYYPLENIRGYRRFKIEKELRRLSSAKVEVCALDLKSWANRKHLLEALDPWWDKNINSPWAVEKESMKLCINQGPGLGIDNACLFVEGKLQGFCLYQRPKGHETYVILNHIKATHHKRTNFELLSHLFAKHFSEQGVKYANINCDMGSLRLRVFMLTLGPVNFFRKYRIEPA